MASAWRQLTEDRRRGRVSDRGDGLNAKTVYVTVEEVFTNPAFIRGFREVRESHEATFPIETTVDANYYETGRLFAVAEPALKHTDLMVGDKAHPYAANAIRSCYSSGKIS